MKFAMLMIKRTIGCVKWGVFMETEEKKVYTIEDIAQELGVSKTTVSRAISGKGRIGQATRERVLAGKLRRI